MDVEVRHSFLHFFALNFRVLQRCALGCRLVSLEPVTVAGIMVVWATPNLPVAGVLSSLFFGIWNLFTGFLIGHQVGPWGEIGCRLQ
jgi:hypothetical protein